MRPFLQEPDNAVAPEELPPVPLPLFLSYGAITEHGHSEDTGKVMVYHYKAHRAEMNSSALWKDWIINQHYCAQQHWWRYIEGAEYQYKHKTLFPSLYMLQNKM